MDLKIAAWLVDDETPHARVTIGNGWPGGNYAESLVRTIDAQNAIHSAVAAERERWVAVVTHAVKELEALDDETAQAQAAALRELLGPNKAGIALDTSQTLC